PDYLEQFKIDRNGNGVEDHVVEITFRNVANGGQIVQVVGPVRPAQTGARNKLIATVPAVQGLTGGTVGNPNGVLTFTGLRDDPFVFDLSQFNRILAGSQAAFRDMTAPFLRPLLGPALNGAGSR